MKTFYCNSCGSLLFFGNSQCLHCGHSLGFLPDCLTLSSLDPTVDRQFRALAPQAKNRVYKQCANALQHQICNWLVPAEDTNDFCASCRLNLLIPNLTIAGNLDRWCKIEEAKRRVLYALYRLNLPTEGTGNNPRPLRFKFLNDGPDGKPILTGHVNGEITINIAEADDDERERRRLGLREPYRTLVGHLRHELAHYYWDHLIANSPHQETFRKLFGDDTVDYDASLKTYYQQGPPADWPQRFVSAYACSHPWEDWAETWAHYLHMVDTLEAAGSFGMVLQFPADKQTVLKSEPAKVPVPDAPFDEIVKNWLPLATAVNSVNRAMGLADLYPFVLTDTAIEKMRFIHDVIHVSMPAQPPIPSIPTPEGSPKLESAPEALQAAH